MVSMLSEEVLVASSAGGERGGLYSPKERLLEFHALGRGLHHQPGFFARGFERGCERDAGEHSGPGFLAHLSEGDALVQVGADAGEAALRGSLVGVVEGDAVPGHRRHLRDPVPHDAGAEDGDAFDPGCHAATRP